LRPKYFSDRILSIALKHGVMRDGRLAVKGLSERLGA
jgi:hypothetical protein